MSDSKEIEMISDSEIERGRALVSELAGGEGDANTIASELLRMFYGGFPLENLVPVLNSSNPATATFGAWIASELGYRAKPILRKVAALLHGASSHARFYALDTVLVCAGEPEGDILAAATQLVDDSEPSVRWKAVQFLIRASKEQLDAALRSLAARGAADSVLAQGLRRVVSEPDDHDILDLLASASATLKRIAVAAAVRRSTEDEGSLRAAATSADEEIAGMAREELEMKAKGRARREESNNSTRR